MFAGSPIVPPAARVFRCPSESRFWSLAVLLVEREEWSSLSSWKQEHAAVFFQLCYVLHSQGRGGEALAYGEVPAAFSLQDRRAQRQ